MEEGLASGTWKNKGAQQKMYIKYITEHGSDPAHPSQYDILSYVLHLNDGLASTGAVLNYVSGARTWVRAMGGDTAPFDSYSVTIMKRGIQRTSTHEPSQAPPMTPDNVKMIVGFLKSAGPNGPVLTAAILLAYFTLLRQSNMFIGESLNASPHILRMQDIMNTPEGINVRVRSTKTRWRSAPPVDIAVPFINESPYCPVRAWNAYVREARPDANGYAFVTVSGLPLRAASVSAVIQLALLRSGHPSPGSFTLHSLRRGGAQACARLGVRLADIQELGTWTSQAVHSYVPRNAVLTAPKTLSKIFA